MEDKTDSVPNGLRTRFVIHFAADVLFGVPLLFFPHLLLQFIGWQTYDPITARLVGAALMGIGIESLLGRNASVETFRAMLNLKVIWASSALIAIGIGIAEGAALSAWLFLAIFFVFWCVWVYYRMSLRTTKSA